MSNHSSLLALPAELRLQVYGHVFTVPNPFDPVTEDRTLIESIDTSGAENKRRQQQAYPAGELRILISNTITTQHTTHTGQPIGQANFIAVLRTSRLIHKEAIPVLYNQLLVRIALGARGTESISPSTGKLHLNQPLPKHTWPVLWPTTIENDNFRHSRPLHDPALFTRTQNLHLSLDFGPQVNPIWDALPVIRALALTLPPPRTRHRTTASLRFGVAVAMTISRLLPGPWEKFLLQL